MLSVHHRQDINLTDIILDINQRDRVTDTLGLTDRIIDTSQKVLMEDFNQKSLNLSRTKSKKLRKIR